jgi:hypothetical protein
MREKPAKPPKNPMRYISKAEYARRRKLEPHEMTGDEWCAWWDFPLEFRGFAEVEIGGKDVWIDLAAGKGSVPTVLTRPYLPC